MRKKLFFYFLLCLLITSCISKKKIVYFQNGNFTNNNVPTLTNTKSQYLLQPRDVLSIRVKTLDTETATYFNISSENGIQQLNPAGLYINGYSVDSEGNITLPEVGKVNVANLPIGEAQKKIQEKIREVVSNATILVKLVSFKITVLGEVKTPGYYYVYNEQATVLEAIGLAGDLTDFASRRNISLIRQVKDGSQTISLDLGDVKLLSSDYYYLMPNDVIYVQPLKAKIIRTNISGLSALSILFGAVSTIILLLNYTK